MGDHFKHAPDKVGKALAILAKNDNLRETSRITGVPVTTLLRWKLKHLGDPRISLPEVRGLSRDQVIEARRVCWKKVQKAWQRIDRAIDSCKSPRELVQVVNLLLDKVGELGLMLVNHDGSKEPKKKSQPRKASDDTLDILEKHPSGEGTDPVVEGGGNVEPSDAGNSDVTERNKASSNGAHPEEIKGGTAASSGVEAP